MLKIPEGKKVFSTHGESVLSSDDTVDVSALEHCSHAEANKRMMIHVVDASLHGYRQIKIRSNDTDVVVLAVFIATLPQLDELWVSHGSCKQI